MKKSLFLFITFIYLIPSIGFGIDLHWCGKKVHFVSINSTHEKRCACKQKMKPGCCKDKYISFKLSSYHKQVANYQFPSNNSFNQLLNFPVFSFIFLPAFCQDINFKQYHSPPFKIKPPVYLILHTFLI